MPFVSTNLTTFARQVRVYADEKASPAARSAQLARVARTERDALIAEGRASADYETAVDGIAGVAEDFVKPDGVIVYTFNVISKATQFAYDTARRLSPFYTGKFQNSWVVAVDGILWQGSLQSIPPRSVVWITNTQPYWRKIDVGHMRMDVDHHIADAVRRQVLSNFESVTGNVLYTSLPSSLGGNYVLKGRFRKGHRKAARSGLYKDTGRGAEMTYPTIELFTKV